MAGARERDGNEPTQAEIQLSGRRYEVAKSLVYVLYIAALWIPLQAVRPIAEAFAGKDTSVTLTITITIGLSVAFGAGMLAILVRTREQRRELRRLRRRCADLERELESSKGQEQLGR